MCGSCAFKNPGTVLPGTKFEHKKPSILEKYPLGAYHVEYWGRGNIIKEYLERGRDIGGKVVASRVMRCYYLSHTNCRRLPAWAFICS